jgi:hypothetical protein
VIVHLAGPFRKLPLGPLAAAERTGSAYVDVAEDRAFCRAVRAHAPATIPVLTGCSVCPAMEAMAVRMGQHWLDRIDGLRTFAAPDTRRHRGPAMFDTMLWGVGRTFRQPRSGRMVEVIGWSEPEWIAFPPPVGRRLTYLVLEMADLDLLPRRFGLSTVEFKAGADHAFLNRSLAAMAALSRVTRRPPWERLLPMARAISWTAGRVGRDRDGVAFELRGAGPTRERRWFGVTANHNGGRIPIVLAGMAVQRLLDGRMGGHGVVEIDDQLSAFEFVMELHRRGLQTWRRKESAKWMPFPSAA